jgi:MATE family multidrug resistance protein
MLEGYFIGLKQGTVLRNAVLLAFAVGFAPLAIAAGYTHNNHILWSSLVGYVTMLAILLAFQVASTLATGAPEQLKTGDPVQQICFPPKPGSPVQ